MNTVEVMWRGTRNVTPGQLAFDKGCAIQREYTVYTWADVNHARQPVTLTRIVTQEGQTLALYETTHTA